MTQNLAAVALIGLGLFLVGGVISFVKSGPRLMAVLLGVGAAMAIVAGVLRW